MKPPGIDHPAMEFCCLCGMARHTGTIHLCTLEVVNLLARAASATA